MPDRSVVYRLKADVTQFKAQMASAAASVSGAADKMTAADKSGAKFRAGLTTLGGAAGKVGLAAAIGLGAAVLKAANFDQAMSQVSAATHETAGNMDRLREAALKAGADTAFSATEAAKGIEELSKAGVSTADILAGGLTGALALAAAGGQEVGAAAESAATAMTQFGLSGKDIPHIADLLAAGAGKAQGSVADLSAALNQGGLVAAQMGLSIEDTTGTLAAFASAGLVGSDAGTSFKSMIQRLQNPLGQGAKAMERLGINAYDASGKFVGIAEVAGQLQSKLSGLTQAQRDAAMAQIFGSDAVRAATVLYKNGEAGIQGWIDKTNDSGYAADTAARRMANLKGDLEKLGGSLETALIGTGDGSQGPLRALVQNLTGVVNAYNKLPGAAQAATGSVLGVTAALGGGIFVFSKLVGGIASTRVALGQLGVSASRTGTLMRGALNVGAVLVGLQLLDDALDQVFDKNLDSSKLGRSLDALAAGTVKGELSDKFGKDLDDFALQLDAATNSTNSFNRTLNEIPLVGGFLSGDFLPHDVETGVQNIKAIDEALAGLVESGQQVEAAAVFDVLAAKAKDAGLSTAQVAEGFAQYQLAVKNVAADTAGAATAQGGLAGAAGQAAGAMDANAAAATANAEALKAAREAASETAHSFVGLGDSVNNAKVGLSGWIRQMANQADALNNFTNNSVKAATRGLNGGLIKALQGAGKEGALRMRQLANATDKEIGAANQAWAKGARAASRYTNTVTDGAGKATRSVGSLNAEIKRLKDKRVKMDQKGAEVATAKIRALRAQIGALHDRTVNINVQRRYAGNSGIGGAEQTPADGGTIYGQRHPYGDKVHAYLAPGEEVISNRYGQADRHRALLKAINAGRMSEGGTVQHLANGGTARRGGGGGNTAALRHELERLRVAAAGSATAITRETATREALALKRSELASTVKDKFTSELFGDSNVWQAGGGAGGAFGILKADIAKAKTFKSLLYGLSKRGLDGDALAELASTGDVGKAQAFSAMSTKDLGTYESLYRQRATAASAVGSYAGMAAFSFEQKAANGHLAASTKQLAALNNRMHAIERVLRHSPRDTGREVGRAVNGAASAGQRRRNR